MSLKEEIENLQRYDISYNYGDSFIDEQRDGEYLDREEVLGLIENEDEPLDYPASLEEIKSRGL